MFVFQLDVGKNIARFRDISAGTGMVLAVGEHSTRRSSCSCKRIHSKSIAIVIERRVIELMSPDGDSGFGNRGLINRG